jgi:hypothetical protein
VLAKQEKIRVRSEKFHGGAGLRRWNRSRGFSTIFPRRRNFHGNYRIFQGPNHKTFTAASHVLQIAGDLGHERSREVGEKKEDDEGIQFHT